MYLGPVQVRVYLYDDLKRDVRSFISSVYSFLGIDPSFWSESFNIRFNTSAKPRFVRFDQMLVEPLSRHLLTLATRAKLRERVRQIYYRGIRLHWIPRIVNS